MNELPTIMGRGPGRLLGAADGRVFEASWSAVRAVGLKDPPIEVESIPDPLETVTVEFSQTWRGIASVGQATGYLIAGRIIDMKPVDLPEALT